MNDQEILLVSLAFRGLNDLKLFHISIDKSEFIAIFLLSVSDRLLSFQSGQEFIAVLSIKLCFLVVATDMHICISLSCVFSY